MAKKPDNLAITKRSNSQSCSVCRELLANFRRFFDMLETARTSSTSDWLTVDEIAKELKISKSIVYRLIRHGELGAVDLVETNGEIPKRGHYRIRRQSLNEYLESKKVQPSANRVTRITPSKPLPKVKNHLGL